MKLQTALELVSQHRQTICDDELCEALLIAETGLKALMAIEAVYMPQARSVELTAQMQPVKQTITLPLKQTK